MELHHMQSGRLTYDLDIAITVNDWEQWLSVEQELLKLENFTKDNDQKQRFIYKDTLQQDIVPFAYNHLKVSFYLMVLLLIDKSSQKTRRSFFFVNGN
ncbi:hypothetical protein [Galbibacter sp. PAP.153]|uniref:hypothetical protein n=1 Tax=Galbibacter sp. PAP.153 TaxID=3104623 RepID=UPI003009FB0F